MKSAIICDIDGCVIDTDWIWEEVEKKKISGAEKWLFFNKNSCDMVKAKIDDVLLRIIKMQLYTTGAELIFSTARSECLREQTRKILQDLFEGHEFLLYMRPDGCLLPSEDLKEAHLQEIRKNFIVVQAYDNEAQNCMMYSKNGVDAIQWISKKHKGVDCKQACTV